MRSKQVLIIIMSLNSLKWQNKSVLSYIIYIMLNRLGVTLFIPAH